MSGKVLELLAWMDERAPQMTPRYFRSLLTSISMLVVLLTSTWCVPAHAAPGVSKPRITGSASYRERIALTPAAVFEATLEDVSRADAPAEIIASVRRQNPGQVPITFEIPYETRRIDARRKYAVRASIYVDGRLRFTSGEAYPVLTQNHGNKVTVLMHGARAAGGREPGGARALRGATLGALPATYAGLLPCADCAGIRHHLNLLPGGAYVQRITYLRDHEESFYELGTWSLSGDGTLTLNGGSDETYWALKSSTQLRKLDRAAKPIDSQLPYELKRQSRVESIEPRLQLRGMFRYVADAPRFRECHSGLEWPVATSGDYLALERAYTARRGAHGSELMVSLKVRIEQRPKMEGAGSAPTLVVEKFVRAIPGERCKEPAAAGIENTRWRPIRIGGRTVTVSGHESEPWIMLDPRSKRVTGSGGCNRISGNYETSDGVLRFGPMISTKMACPALDTETAFLGALGETRRYRARGRTLDLLDDRGTLLMRLGERNLR